ncbi:hypothetical protein Tco_0613620 [Tanacetum coccineum]
MELQASAGKSPIILKQLLASSILNAKSGIEAVATLPFATSSVSATLEHESGVSANSITGLNLRTIGASERFVISLDSSHHSSTNVIGAEDNSIIMSDVVLPVMTKAVITTNVASIPSATAPESGSKVITLVYASMFQDSESTGMVRPDAVGSSHPPGKELSLGSWEVDSESLYEVFVPRWNIPNDALLDKLDASREFIDHLAPPVLFAQIRDMDYKELFIEFNVGIARQACLSAEVRMRAKYCLSDRIRLESEFEKQAGLLKSRDEEIENLKAQLLLKEAEAAEAVRVRTQKNAALEDENESLNGKVAELQSLVSVKDHELKDVDVTVTSLKSQNDGLADQVRALETTCFGLYERLSGYENLTERLEEFQNAELKVVNERVEKLDADLTEMACHLEEKFYPHLLTTISGRRWLLTHGLKLVLFRCLNSSAYLTALGAAISHSIEKGMQDGLARALIMLHEVDFHLLADLKSHKDASIKDIMNLLRLESPLADAPRMDGLQPDVEQLRVPIHRANIAAERSALLGAWTPLSEPLSVQSLIGAAGTSAIVPAVIGTTTALSTTFASASTIPPISVDDYKIIHADGQENSQGNVMGVLPWLSLKKRI